MPVQPSNAGNRTGPAQLPHLDNQRTAKFSLDNKWHGRATVLPLLCPEYKSRTAADWAQPEQFKATSFSSTNLFEAPLDSAERVEAPSGPEHLPKILQACDYQNEELLHFNQQSTAIPRPDRLAEVLPCSYSQTKAIATPLTCPSYQTEALTNSRHWARTKALMSENLNQHRAKVTPLPCLDHRSRATAVTASDLNPWIKTSARKASDHPSKLTASLQGPDCNTRAMATSSSQCSHCSKDINSGSPCSKPYVVSTPSLVIMGKAITVGSSDTKIQSKPKPSTSESLYNRHKTTSMSLCVSYHQARTPPGPDYKSKGFSISLPLSNPQVMSSPCSENCAKVSSNLKSQFINSSGISHWVEALPQSNCWAIPRIVSSSHCEDPSGPCEDGEATLDYICQATSKQGFDRVSTTPSGLDHHAELQVHQTQQDTTGRSLNNCNNALLGFTSSDTDHWAEIQLTSDVWDTPLQSPNR
ncbi:uncharacterized protein LOC118845895 [Trichosurus vulpecula]|uniref:uncharacterized protein LOC118845895 n=1 Tax=Trichosurus vulpecula TaxID=9337 RepID=UPI00186B1CE7|nr:uncharacterized protein LOC118845895 [Trichosurus vulpecula]XP_036609901.1 uncharacterized protein LOC118845895 [Trichosurus vulpecula]